MVIPAAMAITRFFGLTAANTKARPAAFTGVKASWRPYDGRTAISPAAGRVRH